MPKHFIYILVSVISFCYAQSSLADSYSFICDRAEWPDGSLSKNSYQGSLTDELLTMTTIDYNFDELKDTIITERYARLSNDTVEDWHYPLVYRGSAGEVAFVFLRVRISDAAERKFNIAIASPHTVLNWKYVERPFGIMASVTNCEMFK